MELPSTQLLLTSTGIVKMEKRQSFFKWAPFRTSCLMNGARGLALLAEVGAGDLINMAYTRPEIWSSRILTTSLVTCSVYLRKTLVMVTGPGMSRSTISVTLMDLPIVPVVKRVMTGGYL